jgi:outer membrane receptor for ferrienterochelin and colicins
LKNLLSIFTCFLLVFAVNAQTGTLSGKVSSFGKPIEFVNIQIEGTNLGTITDENGGYQIKDIPLKKMAVIASFVGYTSTIKEINLSAGNIAPSLDFDLIPTDVLLDRVVVTGTKTFKRQTKSPVIVNVISSQTLDNVQACNLSEGLKFQPGLRVEVDCQTCNYTQLRMNGLGGGYSQILINGRPIFSPLTGLYGMEQIPTNMVERIEIVRGGGSALYGSSAIGGTVNVITKIPKKSSFDFGHTYQSIAGGADDHIFNGNATILSKSGKAGASIFINNRRRDMYDHNGDNFSELPELKNNSFGTNLFFQPKENQKLEISLSSLNEYRYGGEMVNKAAHLAQQSEERTHNVLMGSIDYQINFNDDNNSFIAYLAGQNTNRDHFTGIAPDASPELTDYLINPPYGISKNKTYQGGLQFNHRLNRFLSGKNVLTFGTEYVLDDVFDEIEAYQYKVDQVTKNFGMFLQSDWEISSNLNLLTGLRADKHNLVDKVIYSPRVSLLYRLREMTQFRLTWGTGFRAPQAFDADLHIAFAGGGVSRISLAPDLKEERSNSISGSINYDKATENFIAGFTIEGFYTHLKDAFYQHPIGEDAFGERFEKRNGPGSTVKGGTFELRANYRQKMQLEAGITIQSSLFDQAVENIEGLESLRKFLRTPNEYGYATLSFFPNKQFNAALNLVYTGKMTIAHFAGAEGVEQDEYVIASSFTNLGAKVSYTFDLKSIDTGLELFGGVKNMTNAYQNDFDIGKNRDSNFIYGPAAPRTFFIGLRIKSF